MTAVEFDPLTREDRAILQDMERQRLAGRLGATGLLILADLYADAGDDDMAAFCRHMPDDPRCPSYNPDDFPSHPYLWWLYYSRNGNKAVIGNLVRRLDGVKADSWKLGVCYPSREAAERALGRALRLTG